MRANAAIRDSRKIQDYFRFHRQCTPANKAIFEKEFLKQEIIAMAELLETIWGLDEDSIVEITNAIKQNIQQVEDANNS